MVHPKLSSSPEELRYFAGGILSCCIASVTDDTAWLEEVLARILGPDCFDVNTRAGLIARAKEILQNGSAEEMVEPFAKGARFGVGSAGVFLKAVLEVEVRGGTPGYDARLRESLIRFGGVCGLWRRVLMEVEGGVGRELVEEMISEEVRRKEGAVDEERKRRRWMMIGGAGIVGGVALGLSGGLLAPAIVPALSSVGVAGISTLSATGSAAVVGTVFGAAGAGISGKAMANRTGDVNEFDFERCSAFGVDLSPDFGDVKLTKSEKVHEIALSIVEGDEGGIIAWEYYLETSGKSSTEIAIGLYLTEKGEDSSKRTLVSKIKEKDWIIDEEHINVTDKAMRKTGATTVMEPGYYVLRWRLVSKKEVNLKYRVAHVPPGRDVPVWLMEDNEEAGAPEVRKPRSLSVTLFIPGLLPTGVRPEAPGAFADQFENSAKALNRYGGGESFALRWESQKLSDLTIAMVTMIRDMAVSAAGQAGLKLVLGKLALGTLIGAMALPVGIAGTLKTLIENQWSVVMSRAREAGRILAQDVLESYQVGRRPVSLAGYSAGALVIFSCLEELASRERTGIVHEAFLLGAPVPTDLKRWRSIRKVVSGRLVNCYMNDWYLELFHRAGGGDGFLPAGIRPVGDGEVDVENIDVRELGVQSHEEYIVKADEVLVKLGVGNGDEKLCWPNPAQDANEEERDSACPSSADASHATGGKSRAVEDQPVEPSEGELTDSSIEVFANERRRLENMPSENSASTGK